MRTRGLAVALMMLLCFLAISGCVQFAQTKELHHSVSMECTDWLYEALPSHAEVGATVNVKIYKAYDVGYLFLVNGEPIEMSDDTDEYWLFSFTMPDEDVVIDFKTYDGFLPDAAYSVLIEAFWVQNPRAEHVSIREYYGEYGGSALVAMIDCGGYTANEWSEEIAGCEFLYGDGNRLQVLCEGVFYTLGDAYAKGHLSDTDIQTIFARYKRAHAGVYEDIVRPEKPVIYLYPIEETGITVKLKLNGTLTCTYPAYNDGWTVTATPDGTLTDASGRKYYCLYWEGKTYAKYDFSRGFCVSGEDTAAFLEDALTRLGLTEREANEFIIYWLPQMEQNPYNLISFQSAAYTDSAALAITPAPDSLLRVFMAWKPLERAVAIEPQALEAFERVGFSVVEWGGAKVK